MPNEHGKAYGLTALCQLGHDSQNDQSFAAIIKGRLRALPTDESSPLAAVPNLYMCRLFVLDDVFYQGHPARTEHLQSKYLVFVAELHGQPGPVLESFWRHAESTVRELWEFCVDFHAVHDARAFAAYIQRCQVQTTFYFDGSNDLPLAEQLKSLYLKQEFALFARAHQGYDATSLQRAFKEFVARVQPFNLAKPTWRAGAISPDTAATGG